MKWKIELDEEMKLMLSEDIRKHMESINKNSKQRLIFSRDLKWKITNIHSKPFIVWSVDHFGLCDGEGSTSWGKNKSSFPVRALKLSSIVKTQVPM